MTLRFTLVAFAVAAAVVPFPAGIVEHRYSQGMYPRLQSAVTPVSNLFSFALLDVFAAITLTIGMLLFVRATRRFGLRKALLKGSGAVISSAALVFLVFLLTWGLNYRRVPLEEKLDFRAERLRPDAAVQLASVVVQQTNTAYAAAQQASFDAPALEAAFIDAQGLLGRERLAAPGRPKLSVLQPYFRWTAIDGMTVPGFLEVILNPDLLPYEVPFTLAHEWGHLAGYADEAEANFFAWLACVRSPDPLIKYSGWLEAYGLALRGVPRGERASVPKLDEGPRQDLQAISARIARSSPRARTAARGVYDSYLKANRVDEGIHSYDAALRLMLGTTFDERWTPVRR